MFHDWDGNGKKDDMFDNFMDYMMYKNMIEDDEDKEDDDDDDR